MTAETTGLRERKRQATEKALREAALRLALELGPANVRVDDIAEAAGVSVRTYNNYFPSREHAIVAAVTAERDARVARAVAARIPHLSLAAAVVEAIVQEYTDPGGDDRGVVLLLTSAPALRETFLGTTAGLERALTEVLAERVGPASGHTAAVLGASVAAAVRIALDEWLQFTAAGVTAGGLVVPTGSLPDLLRSTLAPLIPALDRADAALTCEADG